MALNIPNVDSMGDSFLKGIDTGSTLFTRMMQPVLEREKQKQLEAHFQEQLKLDKMANARQALAAADAHRKMDPMYEINQYKALENWVKDQAAQHVAQQQAAAQNGGQIPDLFGGQQPNINLIPKNKMGLNQDSMNNLMSSGLNEMPEVPNVPTFKNDNNDNSGGIDLDLLRSNPMLRGFAKKHLGYDPLETEKYQGPARDASDLEKLRKDVGEDSPVYQNAKAAYDAQVDAKKDLRDARARTRAGLKTGETEFFDEKTKIPLGKNIPLTAKERESEQGNILFNELYPYVYKGASPFSGEGSITRLQQAAANYKTDPKARKLFDDYLLADKLLAATTVNEASTLKAGRTNNTYNMLKESLEAQDIPKVVKKLIKEYNLPASAQLRAGMRYQKILSDARQKARKNTPATQKLFYDPEMQAKHEQEMNEGEPVSASNEVIVIDPNGKRFKTTESNAAHLPEGWSRG